MQYYSWRITKNAISAFETIFTDIKIIREDGNQPRYISVPLYWSLSSKNVQIDESDYDLDDSKKDRVNIETTLPVPAMAILFKGWEFDNNRSLNRVEYTSDNITNKTYSSNITQTEKMPVPYNVNLSLLIKTKYLNDMFDIIEQIIPLFMPSRNLQVKTRDLMESESIKIKLTGVNLDDVNSEISESDSQRLFTASLDFILYLNYYMPNKLEEYISDLVTDIQISNEVESTLLKKQSLTLPIELSTNKGVIIGEYDPNKTYKNGDIIIKDNLNLIYNSDKKGFLLGSKIIISHTNP